MKRELTRSASCEYIDYTVALSGLLEAAVLEVSLLTVCVVHTFGRLGPRFESCDGDHLRVSERTS